MMSSMTMKVALHPLARATLTFDRQLHYLILIQFYQNYTHIVGKMLEMWMLYSHLQFEFYERRGRHRTHFAFFQNFMWWGTTCRHPNFASKFWYEKTLKFIWILRQCMQNIPYIDIAVSQYRFEMQFGWNRRLNACMFSTAHASKKLEKIKNLKNKTAENTRFKQFLTSFHLLSQWKIEHLYLLCVLCLVLCVNCF